VVHKDIHDEGTEFALFE